MRSTLSLSHSQTLHIPEVTDLDHPRIRALIPGLFKVVALKDFIVIKSKTDASYNSGHMTSDSGHVMAKKYAKSFLSCIITG